MTTERSGQGGGSPGVWSCLGARRAGDGSGGGVCRRLPGLPRRDHRQRRLPVDPGVVPRHVDRRAVVGAQRLQHRLRGVPHRLRPAHRPARPAAGVRRRHRAVHARVRAVRRRADRSSCWSPPGSSRRSARRCWCPPRSPWSSRPSRASGGRTPSACGARPRPWPPGSGRRSAAPWSSSAAGAGRSWSTCPFGLAAVRGRPAASSSRAGRPGRRVMPDLVGAALLAGRAWRCSTSASSRAATGAGPARGARLVRRRRRAAGAVRASARGGTARRCSTRRCCASGRSRIALGRHGRWPGLGFYAYLLTNILWLQYVWGYDVLRAGLALVPGALVAAVVAARLGPAGRAVRLPRRSSCPARWSGPAPTSGTTSRSGSSRPSGPSGCRARCSAASASAPPCRCWAAPRSPPSPAAATPPRRPWCPAPASSAACSASRSSSSSSATRRPATAVAAFHDGWVLSIVAFVVVAAGRPAAGPAAAGARTTRRSTDGAGALVLPPDSPPAAVEPPTVDASVDRPVRRCRCSPRCRDARAAAGSRRPPGASTSPRATWLLREGDPPGSAYVVRSGRLEVLVGGTGGPRARARARSSASSRCSPASRARPAVRARRDTTLLEVPRDAFDECSAATRQRPGWCSARSPSGCAPPAAARPRPARPPSRVVVAVVGLHAGSGAADVAAALHARLATHLSRGRPRRGRPGRAGAGRAATTTGCCSSPTAPATAAGRGLAGLLPAAGRRRRAGRAQ